MNKSLLGRSFLFLSLGLLSFPAFAGNFCVSNFTTGKLAWSVSVAGKASKVFQTFDHGTDQQWVCADIDDKGSYQVEVSSLERINTEPACVFPAKANEWAIAKEVTGEKDADLQCEHFNAQGKLNDVKDGKLGYSGVVIRGYATLDKYLVGADVVLTDPKGAIVGKTRTNTNGYFEIRPYAGNGVRIDIRGGKLGNLAADEAFRGSLVLNIGPEFVYQRDFAHVNIGSTLVAAVLLKNKQVSLESARTMVRRYLGLGRNTDLDMTERTDFELFSPSVYLARAKEAGGFNPFILSIVDEIQDPEAVRAFRGPKLLKNFVAKALLVGILEKAGGEIFAGLIDKMGLASKELQEIAKLNAQLEVVNAKLDALALNLQETRYEARVNDTINCYDRIKVVLKSLNDENNASLDRERTPYELEQLRAALNRTISVVERDAEVCVIGIHTLFKPPTSSVAPFQRLWAEALDMKSTGIVRKSYFTAVDEHVTEFLTMQTIMARLLIDVQLSQGKTAAANYNKAQVKNWIQNEELRALPNKLPYTNAEAVAEIEAGGAFYQRAGQRLWKTQLRHFRVIEDVWNYKPNGKDKPYVIDSYDLLREVSAHAGTINWKIEDAMVNWGFEPWVAAASKMIFLRRDNWRDTWVFVWMGNDQPTHDSAFWDPPSQFYSVTNSKGLKPGHYMLQWSKVD